MPEKGLKRATLVALFFLLYLKAKFSLIKRIFLVKYSHIKLGENGLKKAIMRHKIEFHIKKRYNNQV